jgi:hypothetical protein
MSEQSEPKIITLDESNSVQIILQFVDVAQSKGVFILSEAEILKRCRDILLSNVSDPEINIVQAKQLTIQAIIKGQSKGSFTLDDASILHKVCQYINTTLTGDSPPHPVQATTNPLNPSSPTQIQEIDDDMSSLSAPVPLKTSKPRHV